jgi:hypothetical protein
MGSGAMIHIPSYTKISSATQWLIRGDTQTRRQRGNSISLLSIQQIVYSENHTQPINAFCGRIQSFKC